MTVIWQRQALISRLESGMSPVGRYLISWNITDRSISSLSVQTGRLSGLQMMIIQRWYGSGNQKEGSGYGGSKIASGIVNALIGELFVHSLSARSEEFFKKPETTQQRKCGIIPTRPTRRK